MICKVKELLENPIFLKDFKIRKRKEDRKKIRIPGYMGYLAVLTLPLVVIGTIFIVSSGTATHDWWRQFSQITMAITIFLQLFYFIFKSISNSFSLFSSEKELRTYGGLISSMLSPADILHGKFMVAFYPLFLEITGFFPLFMGIGLLFKLSIGKIFAIYIINVIVIFFFTLLGLYCSMTSNSSSKSHSRAAFIAGFLLVGTLIIDSIIAALFSGFIPFTIFLNPGAAFASVLFSDQSSYNPTWFNLIGLICPLILLVLSIQLWHILKYETRRLPER